MNRWSLREWTPILPWPTCPLAGQARFGQNMVVGSMRVLLALRGSVPRGVCLDPHFRYKCASPRLIGELPSIVFDELRGGHPRPLTLTDWPSTQLPWVAFWMKELIVWGVLDPVAAFLMSRKLVWTRQESEIMAQEYYENQDLTMIPND